jgi:hypothetical protein
VRDDLGADHSSRADAIAARRDAARRRGSVAEMEERFVSLAIPGVVTVRYAVAGQHARTVLKAIREELAKQVRGESWADAEGGLDTLELGLPLQVTGRTISLSLHGIGAALYGDRESWPTYGALLVAAGPDDGSALDEMAAAYVAAARPVWSARSGAAIAEVDRDGSIEHNGAGLRAALAAFTKRTVAKLQPES